MRITWIGLEVGGSKDSHVGPNLEIDDDTSSWGSAPPGPDHDSDDNVGSWPSIYSYHGSRYPHRERFMDEDGVNVMGSLCRTPHAQYIPWIREWLPQDPDGIFISESLTILNRGIFNHDDIPINSGTS